VTGSSVLTGRSHRRPALDGLRAVAVVAVMAYHLQGGSAAVLRGGFLGVDLFFVLSGYLITGLLLDEHARSGRIDLRAFWSRRVRRLFPALVLVLLAVCAWVWWATPVETWAARRADVLWTLFYAANWHFVAAGQDYFAAYAGASPLRHAWSLAVEEQFYLLWPLALWGLLALGGRRRGRFAGRRVATVVVVVGIVVSAVAMAASWTPGDPSRAYYGTDGRVQELFTGALLAIALRWLRPRAGLLAATRRRLVLVGPLAAGVVLALLVAMPDTSAAYYRGGALLFSVAVAAVLADVELRPAGWVARLLSWRPAVALGVISYGVYLWHWPVVVAWPVPHDPLASAATQAGRVVVTLAVASASYLLVERWVQRGRPRVAAGRPWRVGLSAAIAAAVVLLVGARATALPPGVADQLADRSDSPCPTEQHDPYAWCLKTDGGAEPGIALVGDSTARAFDPGLRAVAARRSLTYAQAAWVRCSATGLLVVPLGQQQPNDDDRACHDRARDQVRAMLAAEHPDLVLVSDAWVHHQPVLVDGQLLQPGTLEHHEAVRDALDSLVDDVTAAGGQVAFVELPPPGPSVSTVLADGRPAGRNRPIVLGASYVDEFNQVLHQVAADRPDSAAVVSVTDLVCPIAADGDCPAIVDGQVVRYDGLHLTAAWSRRIGPALVDRALAATRRH
jgi:peptidoglycan/LPS O-acetylase OafA/YrhL